MTNEKAIKYLQQLYPNGGHCWLDEQRIEAIGMAVKALQKEPVSEDLEEAANEYAKDYLFTPKPQRAPNIHFINGANWQKQQMMKNAVSGHVGQTINGMLRALSDETFGDVGFTAGDKVKLIILKEG